MYPNEEFYEWLESLKKNLAISDSYRDDILLEYIDVAHRNVWTQYYQLDLVNDLVPDDHDWAYDHVTKLATLHLAATYFSNPDEDKRGSNLIDNRMIYRILGSRVNYG